MNPGLVVKLRPTGPWRIGPDSGARNRVDVIYHSDSLYSAVTAAMVRLNMLDEWLDATARRAEGPAVSFSSCFPFQEELAFVVPPRTIWPPSPAAVGGARVRWKSARFVPLSLVHALVCGQTLDENHWMVDGTSECLIPVGTVGPFRTGVRWNAAVDRLTGTSERHSTSCLEFCAGAGLWTVVSFADDAAWERWSDPVRAAFRVLADSGFGGERSRGWGHAEDPEFIDGVLPDLILPRAAVEGPVEPLDLGVDLSEALLSEVPPEAGSPEPVVEAAAAESAPADVASAGPSASLPAEPVSAEPVVEAVATESAPADVASAEPTVSLPAEPVTAEQVVEVAATESAPADVPGAEASASLPAEPASAAPVVEAAARELAPADAASAGPSESLPAEPVAAAPVAEAAATESAPAEASAEPLPLAPVISEIETGAPAGRSAAVIAPPLSASFSPAPEADATVEEVPVPPVEEPPAVPAPAPSATSAEAVGCTPHWLLSLFAPAGADAVDWTRGNYTVVARSGRIESPAASGGLKKQLNMIAEGSVVVAAETIHGAAPDVAPDGFPHPVFRAGFAVSIPLPGRVS